MEEALGGAESDEAAIARAKSGNPDGFRVLVDRHSRAIYRLTYRMTANEYDAEDLVQETFLKAFRQLHRFDGRSSFATWLFRIAANCSLDLLRARHAKEKRMVRLETETAGDPLEHFAASEPSPERLSLSGEIAAMMEPAMRQLSEMERAAFVLRHHQGMSIEDVSAALRVRPNAAKHSIFRAVSKLRRALAPAMEARVAR